MDKLRALLVAAMLTVPSTVAVATDVKPAHGGQAVEAAEYHVELVAKDGVVDLYLADHSNKAIASAGHKAVAILVLDGKSERIPLQPAGEARLSGKASGRLPAAPKGVVQITRPDGKTLQARFN